MNRFEKSHKFRKFGKLLKYDFLESLYSILLINAILLLLMAVQRFIFWGGSNSLFVLFLGLLVPLGYMLSLVFLTITIIKLLYNRIFTPDGYLTFALPVSLDAILISKILVSSAYIILSAVVIAVWAFLMSDLINFREIPLLFGDATNSLIALWSASSVISIMAMNALILLILAILHIGAITRFRTLCGIALFMLFMIIESLCYGVSFGKITMSESLDSLELLAIATTIFNAIKGVFYYLGARYLIANKLEI